MPLGKPPPAHPSSGMKRVSGRCGKRWQPEQPFWVNRSPCPPPPRPRVCGSSLARGDCSRSATASGVHRAVVLPDHMSEVRLVSRSALPTDTRPWLEDRRRLGVYVERITVLAMSGEQRDVPLDHPELAQGWWAVERAGDGFAVGPTETPVLPLPAMDGSLILEIQVSASGMSV